MIDPQKGRNNSSQKRQVSHCQFLYENVCARHTSQPEQKQNLIYFTNDEVQSVSQIINNGKSVILTVPNFTGGLSSYMQQFAQHFSPKETHKLLNMNEIISFANSQQFLNDTVLVSLEGLQELAYKPYLLKLLSVLKNGKFVIFCNVDQQEDIKNIFGLAHSKFNKLFQYEQVCLQVPLPFDYSTTTNPLDILDRFLNDQSKSMPKKGVLIFHQLTQEFKKKLLYLIRTKGYQSFTKIYFEDEYTDTPEYSEEQTQLFIVESSESIQQRSLLKSVYLVLDYQCQVFRYFDYLKTCYYQVRDIFSEKQKQKRVNILYGNIGQYVSTDDYIDGNYQSTQSTNKYRDYGAYCLQMCQLGLKDILLEDFQKISQIKYCFDALQSANIIDSNGQVAEQEIANFSKQKINPLIAKAILNMDKESINIHLLILTQSILVSPNLRKQVQNQRPASIWHQTGYLHSCLDIMIKIFTFQTHNDSTLDFDEILANYQVDVKTYKLIANQYERICKIVGIQSNSSSWQNQLEEQTFQEFLGELILIFKPALASFSGSRRLGYLFKSKASGCLAHRKSLISHFNEKPNFVLATKFYIDSLSNSETIMTCNYVGDQIILGSYGCLPTMSRQSFGECEIQFHSIPTLFFEYLSKYDGMQMQIFQKQYDCSIEANSQLSAITIQCHKEKQKTIDEKFRKMLKDIEEMFRNEIKMFKYSQKSFVALSAGGEVSELIIKQEGKTNECVDKAILRNIAPQVGIEELKQLIDEFVQLKDIKIIESTKENSNEIQKKAIITFYSYRDYKNFYSYFNGCIYYDYCMMVEPFTFEIKEYNNQKYMTFEWNVWKSTGSAIIQFLKPEQVKNAMPNLINLSGPNATIEQKQNIIFIQGLDPKVDQRQLTNWLFGNGRIVNVQIRRVPPNGFIETPAQIRKVINKAIGEEVQCQIGQTIKGKNGLRSCKVQIRQQNVMNEVEFILNEVSNSIGTGKLYVVPTFTLPLKLPEASHSYAKVYNDILEEISNQMGRIKFFETQLIEDTLEFYLIVKTTFSGQIQILESILPQRLQGKDLNLQVESTSLLFTDLALKNILKLEKELPVKIVPDMLGKKIKVLCRPSIFERIEKQINTKILQPFEYSISLYKKAFTYLQKNGSQILKEEISKGQLKIKFEHINKSMIIEATMFMIQKAKQKISKTLQQLKQQHKTEEQGSQFCKLCYQQLRNPYKLQQCGHSFCYDCLQASINYCIKDASLYPLKCPQCSIKVWICDLSSLIEEKQWNRVMQYSVNRFVSLRSDEFAFCLTAGCKFISNIRFKSHYNCKQCNKGYCLSCKNFAHPGMTCHESRYGSDRLLNEYLQNVGGRVCANKSCKAPIERISGCFKVQCSRCQKCMCFKCPANQMYPYNTPEQTYEHMNKNHGGCF